MHFESFLWKEGVLGQRVADALSARARAGVTVRVLLDATGSKKMGKSTEQQLEDSGCKLVKFHKWHIRNLGVMNERDHRKLVVLDGRVALLGGHCIVDAWLGNAEDKDHFADVSVRLRGPIVHSVQAAFSENWVGHTGELFMGDAVFPHLERAGEITVHAAYVKPEGSAPAVKILHHTAICCAQEADLDPESVLHPGARGDRRIREGRRARRRRSGADAFDERLGQSDGAACGHRNFEKLLRCGVRLFEYPSTLLHQKVMTIDGVWCTVGSANFDDRSFEINDEITLGFKDAATAKRLDAIFEKYLPHCQELKLERGASAVGATS